MDPQIFKTIFKRKLTFPQCLFIASLFRDCRYVILFLASVFCPLVYVSIFMPVTCYFDYCNFGVYFESQVVMPPALFFFVQVSWLFFFFVVSYEFYDLPISVKKVIGFDKDFIQLYIILGSMDCFFV